MNVIFLDVDGVLNSMALCERLENILDEPIDHKNVRCLKKLVEESQAVLVLSSSWRGGWTKNPHDCPQQGRILNDALAKYDLTLFDKTDSLPISDGTARCQEIKKWIDQCPEPIHHILILDDADFEWKKYHLETFWVQPDFMKSGFTEEYLEEALAKIRKPYRGQKLHWLKKIRSFFV